MWSAFARVSDRLHHIPWLIRNAPLILAVVWTWTVSQLAGIVVAAILLALALIFAVLDVEAHRKVGDGAGTGRGR